MDQSLEKKSKGQSRPLVFRRRYLIDRKFQLNFSLLLLIIAAVNVFFFCMLFFFYDQEVSFVYQNILGLEYLPEDIKQIGFSIFIKTIIFAVIFETIFILMLGIFFSHRIAGPVFNLRQRIKEIIAGHLPQQIRLRKDDMLQEFAKDMDQLVQKMRTETAAEIELLEKLRGTVAEAEKDNLSQLIEKKKTLLTTAEQ